MRHFEIVAEDLVEADLEGGNAGALAFARFQLGHPFASVGRRADDTVEFSRESRPEKAALVQVSRRIIAQCPTDSLCQFAARVQPRAHAGQRHRAADQRLHTANGRQGQSDLLQIARGRPPAEDAIGQPLQIGHPLERRPQFRAAHGITD